MRARRFEAELRYNFWRSSRPLTSRVGEPTMLLPMGEKLSDGDGCSATCEIETPTATCPCDMAAFWGSSDTADLWATFAYTPLAFGPVDCTDDDADDSIKIVLDAARGSRRFQSQPASLTSAREAMMIPQ